MKNFSPSKNGKNNESVNQTISNSYLKIGPNSIKKINNFKKNDLRVKNRNSTKFNSVFDKEGNPFKYFSDLKKHFNSNSNSLMYSKLDHSKSSNKSNAEVNSLIIQATNLTHNTQPTGATTSISMNNISTSTYSDIKHFCCVEYCNRVSDKLMQFLTEKSILLKAQNESIKFTSSEFENLFMKLIEEIKELIRTEISKIPIKSRQPINPCNSCVPINAGIKSSSNIHELKTNESYKNSIATSLKTSEIILTDPNFKVPVKPKIILNNIKHIIKNNKNSRNHKDIILEDYQSDNTDKYNLNEIGKSNKTLSSNQNQIIDNCPNQTVATTSCKVVDNNFNNNIDNNTNKFSNEISKQNSDKDLLKNYNKNKVNNLKSQMHVLVLDNKKEIILNNKLDENSIKSKFNKLSKMILNTSYNDRNKLRNKVKSFSPSNKRNSESSSVNKLSLADKGKDLKNSKYSFEAKNYRKKMQRTEKNSKSKSGEKISDKSKEKLFKITNSNGNVKNKKTSSSICQNINGKGNGHVDRVTNSIKMNTSHNNSNFNRSKISVNLSDLYNKLFLQGKPKNSLIKNWYLDKETNKNKYIETETDDFKNNKSTILNKQSMNKTNYEKFKNTNVDKKNLSKTLSRNSVLRNNNSMNCNTIANSIIKKNLNFSNDKNMNLNIASGNKIILNNKYYNINNYSTNVLKEEIYTDTNLSNVNADNQPNQNLPATNSYSNNKKLKQIKNIIDPEPGDGYKHFFNFSYDDYMTKEISYSNISDETFNLNENFEIMNKGKKIKKINYTNEISFEGQEDRIKNLVFKKYN